jgi:hypothetical protein
MLRSEPAATKKAVSSYLLWFGLWAAVTLIGIILTPHPDGHGTHRQLGLPPCASAFLLNRPCPGCGLTTSWTAFLHGNIGKAFEAHQFGPILYLAFTGSAFASFWAWKHQRYFVYSKASNRALLGFVIVFVAVCVYRFIVPPASYAKNPFAPLSATTNAKAS